MNTASLINILITLPALLIAVVIHEYSHGRVAELMGDPTARQAGRLTLNPIPHLDPFGSIILPLFLLIASLTTGSQILFAYAKPVPINPYNFRGGRRDLFFVGLAGPASNIVLAFLTGIVLTATWSWAPAIVNTFLGELLFINCLLAVFNLFPVPPLDGSRLVQALLPPRWLHGYNAIEPYGIVIVFGMFFLVPNFFGYTVLPAATFLAQAFTTWPQALLRLAGF